jgi:hypothetical protein
MSVTSTMQHTTLVSFHRTNSSRWVKFEDKDGNEIIIVVDDPEQLGWLLGAVKEAAQSFKD